MQHRSRQIDQETAKDVAQFTNQDVVRLRAPSSGTHRIARRVLNSSNDH